MAANSRLADGGPCLILGEDKDHVVEWPGCETADARLAESGRETSANQENGGRSALIGRDHAAMVRAPATPLSGVAAATRHGSRWGVAKW